MIKKNYQINKTNIGIENFYLFYGVNEGSKSEKINELCKETDLENIFRYEEKHILENRDDFFSQLLNKSLFQDKKFIIINRATEKFFKIFDEIFIKNPEDVIIIINAGALDKRSKLRNFFEKDKRLICCPFYTDTSEILSRLAHDFFKKNNISLSQSNVNLIISRCNGDRGNLINELDKIKFFTITNKTIKTEDLLKLTNLSENYSISELIDSCLAKNKNKTINILSENTFDESDCLSIIRTFLNKSKKLLELSKNYKKSKNLEVVINNYKPPIFWKDKEITKQQIIKWKPEDIQKVIFKLSEIELQIKKNINNSLYLITDFLLEESS
tara:strand:+ start:4854 stop:5837 length:984 start_codon:yes stop_codon:yes gene_type:complete